MGFIKISVNDNEKRFLKKWANGTALAALAKHAVMLRAMADMGVLEVPTVGPRSTHLVPTEAPHLEHTRGSGSTQYPPGTHRGTTPANHPDSGTPVALTRAGTDPDLKREEEEKREETRLAPLYVSEDVIGYLNKMSGSKQRPSSKAHRGLIQDRLNAGATVDDLKTVIRKKCAEWKGTPQQTNLKPSCLFRACNFDGYLGQPEVVAKQKTDWQLRKDQDARAVEQLWNKKKEQPHQKRARLDKERETEQKIIDVAHEAINGKA